MTIPDYQGGKLRRTRSLEIANGVEVSLGSQIVVGTVVDVLPEEADCPVSKLEVGTTNVERRESEFFGPVIGSVAAGRA